MPKPNPNRDRDHPYFNFDGLNCKSNRTFFHGFGSKKERAPEDEDSDKLNYLRELRQKILGLATLSGVFLFAALFASSSLAQNGGGLKKTDKEPAAALLLAEDHLKPTFQALGIELPSTYQVREQIDPKFEAQLVPEKIRPKFEGTAKIAPNQIVNDTNASKRKSAHRPSHKLFSIAHKYGHLPFSIARKNISCSTIPFENDPSRLELFEPIGYTQTQPISIGKYQFKLPAVTRRVSFNFSGICFDLLGNTDTVRSYFKKSPRFKRLFESMSDSFKMGLFYTRNVSRMFDKLDDSIVPGVLYPDLEDRVSVMTQRVLYHDLEDRANRKEWDVLIIRSLQQKSLREHDRELRAQVGEKKWQQFEQLLQEWDQVRVELDPTLSSREITNHPGFKRCIEYRQKLLWEYARKVGPPRKILPENRRLHYYPEHHDRLCEQYYPHNCELLEKEILKEPIQILSETKGSYYEISVLDLLLKLCQVDEDVKEDATRFFGVKVLRTCKNEMTTNLIQFEINVNELAYDALERIIEKMSTRSATIRRIGPVLTKMVRIFGFVFEFKMSFQKGYQESSTYNFNLELDTQRVCQDSSDYICYRVKKKAVVTNFVDPNLEEVNSRWFDHSDTRFWINLDINKILDLFKSRH